MHICIVTPYFTPEIGAAPVRLRAFADSLVRLGHTVEVVCALPNYPTGRMFPGYERRVRAVEQVGDALTVRRVWVLPAQGSGLKRYVNYLTFALGAMTCLRGRRADIVVVESPPLTDGPVGWLFAKVRRAKFVLNVSDLWPDSVVALGLLDGEHLVVRLAHRLERWLYTRADVVNYVTEGMGRLLREDKGLPAKKLAFLPNGVDTRMFSPVEANGETRRARGVEGKAVFLYAGTHSVGAGMEVLADAAVLLQDDDSIRIVAVGDGPAKPILASLVEERGLTNVLLVDSVPPEEVADWYSVAVAGLSTLRANPLFEGTRPAKIFPAMACGRPVLYAGRGEGARLVADNDVGLVVPPEDPGALADAIRRLAGDPALAARLGTNGRRYAESHLSWDALVRRWLASVAVAPN